MVFLEKQSRNGKYYYYLTKTLRTGNNKFKKIRHYVGNFDKPISENEQMNLINKNREEFNKLLKQNKINENFTDFDIKIFFNEEKIFNSEDLKEIDQIKKEYKKKLKTTDKAYLDHIKEEFIIRHSYDTNKAEGNTFTYEETKALIEKEQILKPHSQREIFEITNIKEAYNFIISYKKKLTPAFIKKLHMIVTYKTLKFSYLEGKYRPKNVNVHMGGSDYITVPGGRAVSNAIKNIIKKYEENSSEDNFGSIVKFYSAFLAIHPFLDGNGRVSRMLLIWLLVTQGLPSTNFDSKKHLEHIKYLEESRKGKTHIGLGQFILNRIRLHSWK